MDSNNSVIKRLLCIKEYVLLGKIFMSNNWTSGSQQTVQTQIKLLLLEQFDLDLHCLSFYQYF